MKKKMILLALAFVILTIPAAWLQLREGVRLDGTFFIQKNADLYVHGKDSVSISRNKDGAEISILLADERLDVKLTIADDLYSFVFEDGRRVEGYAGRWMNELVDEQGAPIWMEDSIVAVVNNEPEPSALTREYSLSSALYRMTEKICERRGHGLLIAVCLLIYAIGVASFFWPEEVHFFGRRWVYANTELSDAGIAVQKICGVACAMVSIGLLYAPLFW